jgi:hypothetical protein
VASQIEGNRYWEHSARPWDACERDGAEAATFIQRLMDAELVIADMSHHNANAFYELAVRHMVRLPTIHIIHKDWKIPFDVAPYRAIHFSRQEFTDLNAARTELASVVQEVIVPGFQVENPVTHARARFELDHHATPEIKALADEVATITAKLNSLETLVVFNDQLAEPPPGVGTASWLKMIRPNYPPNILSPAGVRLKKELAASEQIRAQTPKSDDKE